MIPHNHGTRTKELVRALRHFGYTCPDYCTQRKPITFGLAQLHTFGPKAHHGWHWVAIGFGMVWDGHEYGPVPLADYQKQEADGGRRITSFLPVIKL